MVNEVLTKLILAGHAKNKIEWIGFGMFHQIQIPTDSFIVIHRIIWNGFLNQKLENVYAETWKDFFRYNEYALKIKSDKESPMYYQFRNEVDFQFFGAPGSLQLHNRVINDAQFDDFILMQPKRAEIRDTMITAYDYLNFTISRNSLMPTASNFNPVNNYAEEANVPIGINGQPVLLELTMTGTGGTTTTQNPPSPIATFTPPATMSSTNADNYHHELDKPGGGDNGSFLDNPIGGLKLKKQEFVTNPLVGIEYCIIQKNQAGKLSAL
jgi:hypothetical protein